MHYIAHYNEEKENQKKYYLRTKTNCTAINQWNGKHWKNIETFFSPFKASRLHGIFLYEDSSNSHHDNNVNSFFSSSLSPLFILLFLSLFCSAPFFFLLYFLSLSFFHFHPFFLFVRLQHREQHTWILELILWIQNWKT